MKRSPLVASVVVVVFVGAVGLVAQEAGARGGRGTGAITPGPNGKVTVDGCVQSAPPGSASASKYILAGARPTPRGTPAGRAGADPDAAGGTATEGTAPATGTGAAAAPGTAPAAGAAAGAPARGRGGAGGPAAPIRFQLDGDEKVITPHVNHVVEITGTLSGEPAPPARGGGPSGGAAAPITQTLKIESLKMVAALCS